MQIKKSKLRRTCSKTSTLFQQPALAPCTATHCRSSTQTGLRQWSPSRTPALCGQAPQSNFYLCTCCSAPDLHNHHALKLSAATYNQPAPRPSSQSSTSQLYLVAPPRSSITASIPYCGTVSEQHYIPNQLHSSMAAIQQYPKQIHKKHNIAKKSQSAAPQHLSNERL
uniref:Uncharacterized protein n=1 Tax=Physcomitrium patens TaxID=3218 RepID=A0A2K1KE30_PHYPA|nr:hypothetical protein PHYPA_008373 [Physcomitrium patens]